MTLMHQSASTTEHLLTRRSVAACGLLLLAVAALLKLLGREFVSDSGFGLWTGAWTPNTSQWIADPYSASHILHGVFLYWLLLPIARWWSPQARLFAALAIESLWELFENTPYVIERYRANTASLDYYGDSILNSTFDILCALAGFWLAWRFGWKWMIALILVIELSMLVLIRDNLTLNILMLLHPSEAIRHWQSGGYVKPPSALPWPQSFCILPFPILLSSRSPSATLYAKVIIEFPTLPRPTRRTHHE
jgi:Protein of unknown function (DUF2585)